MSPGSETTFDNRIGSLNDYLLDPATGVGPTVDRRVTTVEPNNARVPEGVRVSRETIG